MRHFIKALYADLLHRIDVVVEDIMAMEHHDDTRYRFVDVTLAQFAAIRKELKDALDSGILEFDTLTANNLYKFNNAHRGFTSIHSYRYLALKNYKDPEIFFFKVISRIYNEHRIAAIPPIISTISNHDYYWAVPYFEIIALPVGEENSLLNLPDMYHEIGHLLHSMFHGKSCEQSGAAVDQYFEEEINKVMAGKEGYFRSLLKDAKYLWQASWLEEFTCDLAGVYMTGAAYAWTNLKLLSTGHGAAKMYQYSHRHPSDEARMRIILLMLEKLGLEKEKNTVLKVWSVFLREMASYRPDYYELLYPEELLHGMVKEFYRFYQNADLASYADLEKEGKKSVAALLNEAWEQARTDAENYFDYENAVIGKLKRDFGLLPK